MTASMVLDKVDFGPEIGSTALYITYDRLGSLTVLDFPTRPATFIKAYSKDQIAIA